MTFPDPGQGRQTIASGAAWMYGSQIFSIAVQFAYAAVASRLVRPEDFGYYAVALLISSLAQILSVAGLGQSVARSAEAGPRVLSSLASYGLILGVVAFAAVSIPAPFWAHHLSNDRASQSIALIGVSVLIAPSVGLIAGHFRLLGRFRELSVATMAATFAAQATSICVMLERPSATALVLAPVLQQGFMYLALQVSASHRIWPGRIVRDSRAHLSFTAKATSSNVLSYFVESAPRLAVSTVAGPSALGLWNRGDVLSTIPFDKLQGAFSQVLYPRFGQSLSGSARANWTSPIVASAWINVPITAFLAASAPVIVPIVLGRGWDEAIPIVMVLTIAAGLRGPSVLLASAVESIGRFSWVWATQAVLIVLQSGIVAAVFFTHSVWPGVVSVIAVAALRHTIQVPLCVKSRLIDIRNLGRGYAEVAVVSALLAASSSGTIAYCSQRDLHAAAQLGLLGSVLIVAAIALFLLSPRLHLGEYISLVRRQQPNAPGPSTTLDT